MPASIIEPVWDQCSMLLPERTETHPLGCHRRRLPGRVIFDKLVQVLVFGCADHRIADATVSATTRRRRRDEWIAAGVMDLLLTLVLHADDHLIGLDLPDVAIDGCITKATCGGELAGRSPVDRGKQGRKRSLAVDAAGIPLGTIAAPANRHDARLLIPTLDTLRVTDAAMKSFLDHLPTDSITGLPVAAFDTRLNWPKLLSGAASKGIADRLTHKGARLEGV
jgi:transposase